MVYKSARTHEETIETALPVKALDTVEDTAYHIVAAGSLTTAQYYTYVERFLYAHGVFVTFKLDYGQTISIREKLLDFFLVGYRLGFVADFDFYRTLQGERQLGLIVSAHAL